MVVHPTYRNWSGTVLNGLLWRFRDRRDVAPSIVTRLDKETSGLIVVALGPEIHARIQKDFGMGQVKKEYLALVRGTPTPLRGSIHLPLARDLADRRRVVVTPTGQVCLTSYEVVEIFRDMSLVRCELVTGRTHQIRVHLASSGWPVVGDQVYGESHQGIGRQALHAERITLPHPVTRDMVKFEAPVPKDFETLWISSRPGAAP
jgi:23S rRNA pseudouridine1911/1915/1917 synthase